MKLFYLILFTLFISCSAFNQTTIKQLEDKSNQDTLKNKKEIVQKEKESVPVTIENDVNLKSDFFTTYFVPILSLIVGIVIALIGLLQNRKKLLQSKFEENFFKLLDVQSNILNNIQYELTTNIKDRKILFTGSKCFHLMFYQLKYLYDYQKKLITENPIAYKSSLWELRHSIEVFKSKSPIYRISSEPTFEEEVLLAKYCYSFFFDKYYYLFGHYFRHLYHVFKFVKTNELKITEFGGNSKQYTDLVQARMSSGELCLLFYNSLIFPKMKKYVDEYELTENLAIEDLMNPSHQEFVPFHMKSRKELTEGLFEFKEEKEINSTKEEE